MRKQGANTLPRPDTHTPIGWTAAATGSGLARLSLHSLPATNKHTHSHTTHISTETQTHSQT